MILIIALLLLGSSAVYLFVPKGGPDIPPPLPGGKNILRSQLHSTNFSAITEYALPSPARSPNAIAVAPDGSVWFGEAAIPGVAHLYLNGTLIEYAWPFNYPVPPGQGNSLSLRTDIWGIELWNGRVWAPDVTMNQLVGLDPSTGSVTSIHLPTNGSFPYTMTVGPDDSLWFTELDSSKIGRVLTNGTLIEYPLSVGGQQETPAEIVFENDTLGYYVNIGGIQGGGPSAIYAFNPQKFSPSLVVGNQSLSIPDSIALWDRQGIWVDLHGPSMVGFYNLTDRSFTTYPTSTITYTNTVLPYFIKTNDSSFVWFNEHYGNRIAVINLAQDKLTEYSESNPPAKNASLIDNALTFALGNKGAWFTALTGNFIGYVNASYKPGFSVAISGDRTIQLMPGQEANVAVHVTGDSSQSLSIQFSDSESFTAVPKNITITSNLNQISSLHGEQDLTIAVKAGESLAPGNYTLLITVNGGLVRVSTYLMLEVTR